MALQERLDFVLNAKGADQVSRDFGKIGRSADRDLGKVEKKTRDIQSQFDAIGKASLKFALIGGAAMYALANQASSVNEALSGSKQVFGEAAGAVEDFADSAADSFGISKVEALSAANSIGLIGKQAGLTGDELATFSTSLVGIAGDMASFFDIPVGEALGAIKSGLAGESEALRRVGVDASDARLKQLALNEGLWDGVGALTQSEKAFTTYIAIMRDTTTVSGDYARTAQGLANAQRTLLAQLSNLGASVGQGAVPLFEGLVNAANDTVSAFNALGPSVHKTIGAVATGAVAFAGINGVMTYLGGTSRNLGAILGRAAEKSTKLWHGLYNTYLAGQTLSYSQYKLMSGQRRLAMTTGKLATGFSNIGRVASRAGFAIGAIVGTLYAGITATNALSGVNDKLSDSYARINESLATVDLDGFRGGLKDLFKAQTSQLRWNPFEDLGKRYQILGETVTHEFSSMENQTRKVMTSVEDFDRAIENLTPTQITVMAEEFRKYAEQEGISAQQRADHIELAERAEEKERKYTESIREQLFAEQELKKAMQEALETRNQEAATVEGLTVAVDEQVEALSRLNEEEKVATAGAKAFTDAMDLGTLDNAIDAAQGLGEVLREIGADFSEGAAGATDFNTRVKEGALKDLPRDWDAATASLGGYTQEQFASVDVLQNLGEAMRANLAVMVEEGASREEVVAKSESYRKQLLAILTQLPMSQEAAEEYADALGLIPEDVETAFRISDFEKTKLRIELYKDDLNAVPTEIRSEILTAIDEGNLEHANNLIDLVAEGREAEILTTATGIEATDNVMEWLIHERDAMVTAVDQGVPAVNNVLNHLVRARDAYIIARDQNAPPTERILSALARPRGTTVTAQAITAAAWRALNALTRTETKYIDVVTRYKRSLGQNAITGGFALIPEGGGNGAGPAPTPVPASAPVVNNVTVHMQPGADGSDVVRAVRKYERRNGHYVGWNVA